MANFQAKGGAREPMNDEHALMRHEFMEALIRIAVAKYGKGQVTLT